MGSSRNPGEGTAGLWFVTKFWYGSSAFEGINSLLKDRIEAKKDYRQDVKKKWKAHQVSSVLRKQVFSQ